MAAEDELTSIDTALAELEFKIIDDGMLGSFRNSRDEASFKRLRVEAKTILDQVLGSGRMNSESDLGLVWKAKAISELIATL